MANEAKKKLVEKLSFEEALTELEQIVKQLELGNLELDEAIALYSRGNELKIYCAAKLDQAKLKVEKIIHKDGNAIAVEESSLQSFYEQ